MLDKLKSIEKRFNEVSEDISNPDIINNQELYTELIKEHSHLEPIVIAYKKYADVMEQLESNKEMLNDSDDDDFKEMILEDISSLNEQKEELEQEIKILLIPKDPNDDKNVIVEIRAGVGGDEAALFAGDLLRMYTRYAERNRWKVEMLSTNEIGIGGYKEAVFSIQGKGAYSRLKYESGTHRVQRIPDTESSGRIHTSAITVAVLPEAEDVEVNIDPNDLRVDVYRSSGNGGQSVNTTDSAVRITHIPSGLVVACQDEKSQLKNKDKALKILKARLFEIEQRKQQEAIASNRKSQIGSGDRSERIRTYNFPQGRVTDHRVGLTLYKLNDVLDGDIDEFIDTLIVQDQSEQMGIDE
ncbi:peptide chain release factor 1 [Anaerofustis stercorihominis]|uniref:peptide chain release factor 1 n=1 Tax=Anaerofustis stercorihominis TaxID=214853 RepID=UPI00214BC82C|nr:peptide chain release factor 1 [Anaerofustis stercorihominis]MCR2032989.1 peptide chain release factor 1 [Anaerofustis stercorihominis]